ncbi:MAG: hypothetical protein AB1756_08430 [Acidobacteriota bacterium]
MKKLLVILAAMVCALGFTSVMAGDYHTGSSLYCNECHVMHFSQQHGYNADGTGDFTDLGPAGPYHYLLRNEVNDLCLTCHDGLTTVPDVLKDHSNGVREAGALNRDNAAPYYSATGHTLDATDTAPGGTWAPDPTHGLICVDCHSPHGRTKSGVGSYRNLWRDANSGTIVTYAVGTNDLTKDVYERVAKGYSYDNVDMNEPDTTQSGFGIWCKDCHTDFHGTVGGTEIGGDVTTGEFLRHPTAGVDIGAIGGGHSSANVYKTGARTGLGGKTNWVKVMSPSGDWYESETDSTISGLTPTCITCHKGHGNKNAFGLIYMKNTGSISEQGTEDGGYRDLCKQCHIQG